MKHTHPRPLEYIYIWGGVCVGVLMRSLKIYTPRFRHPIFCKLSEHNRDEQGIQKAQNKIDCKYDAVSTCACPLVIMK